MSDNETDRVGASGERPPKRPYEPPRIVSEGIFETTALACRKKLAQGGKCGASPRNS